VITETVTYLETNKTALGLALVGGAAEFQKAVETNPAATPAAYVIELDETAGPSPATEVHQRVKATIGIVHVVRNVADIKGDGARKDMETLRAATKAKLLGWSIAAGFDPLERARSNLLTFRDGHMWWQDAYTTAYFDRSVL